MQLLATAELMRGFDRAAIHKLGIPGLVLMENAGRAFVDELARRIAPLEGKRAVVVCGKGNNGGDGFVIARHLANRGCDVLVALLARKRTIQGDSRSNLEAILRMSRVAGTRLRIVVVTRPSARLRRGDLIVDAIFGTGFTGDARGIEREAIGWINEQDAFVAAVDIPSGVDATTGMAGSVAVRADLTVAMGMAKVGHYVGRGCDLSGDVRIADISIPPALIRPSGRQVFRILGADVKALLPIRPRNANKYSVGKVFILAGSRSYTGAPVMTAYAALRSGAGAVLVGYPASLASVLAKRLTEILMVPLPETLSGSISPEALPVIRERASWADCIAIGPGLSRDEQTMEVVREVLVSVDRPVIVDADALFALSHNAALLKKRKGDTVLTPHTGEFAALTGMDAEEADRMRVAAARSAARRLRAVVVLKGAPTVTSDPRGTVWVNSTGNPGMATIGSGDVLTGLIAGLKAQGMDAPAAAYAGVYIHGLAGDIAADRFGRRSLFASDIGDAIAPALKRVEM